MASPSTPSLGGMPDVGSGLSGLGQQLADVFGSLLGSADDAVTDTPELGDPDLDGDVDDELDDADDGDDSKSVDAKDGDMPGDPATDPPGDAAANPEEPVEPAVAEGTCEPGETPEDQPVAVESPPPVEPAPTPVPPPEPAPLAEPAEPADPAVSETPCEIAADELPQVGE
jgi:hypothetical protein